MKRSAANEQSVGWGASPTLSSKWRAGKQVDEKTRSTLAFLTPDPQPPIPMDYSDPNIPRVSRVTDDYEQRAKMGCVAVSEPAFWAGFDRGSAEAFRDYFRQLTEFEPQRRQALDHLKAPVDPAGCIR